MSEDRRVGRAREAIAIDNDARDELREQLIEVLTRSAVERTRSETGQVSVNMAPILQQAGRDADGVLAIVWPELERLRSWAGLMETLNEHYPADVFDGSSGDPGPRIIALTREVDRLRDVIDVRRDDDTWTVAIEIPMSLPGEMRDSLWSAITNTVGEWEPDDRDGWDVNVAGYPTAHERDRADRAERERDELKAAVERAQAILPFFEGQVTAMVDRYPALANTLSVTYRRFVFALGQPPAKEDEESSLSSGGGSP